MSRRARTRLAPAPLVLILVLVLAVSLTACAQNSDEDAPSAPSPSTSAETGSDGDAVTVSMTRDEDSFTPNGERVELGVGQTLDLTITSDVAGELHVHSTPEQEIAYPEGTSEHQITVDRPGVVEVESHEPELIVFQLEVR